MKSETTGNKSARFLRSWGVNIAFIALGCLLALALLEISLRIFWRPELAAWQRNLDVIIPLDPNVTTGVAGPAHVRTNSAGIRGDEWSPDRSSEYRILTLGASDTRCLLQDQPNTWPALLQTRLSTTQDRRGVWVGNAGGGGYNSHHVVLAMRFMLDQYDPDAVVILLGGNEAALALNQGLDYDPNFIYNEEKMRKLALDFNERPVALAGTAGPSVRNLFLWMFLKDFQDQFFDSTSARGMVDNVASVRANQEKRRQATRIVDEMPDIQMGLAGFHTDLLEMIRLAHEHHVHLVLMTTPSIYKAHMTQDETNRLWAGWYLNDQRSNAYWSSRVMAEATEAANQVLLKTCQEEVVDCIDLASLLPKSTDIFWDQAHFTDTGSSRVADELVKYFEDYFARTQK
jgi:lysophospholipase L1-like esterase